MIQTIEATSYQNQQKINTGLGEVLNYPSREKQNDELPKKLESHVVLTAYASCDKVEIGPLVP